MRRITPNVIKIVVFALLIVMAMLPIVAASQSSASPASGINLSSSVQVSFPNSITFSVNAQSDSSITNLRLHYIVDEQNYAEVVSEGWPQFTPSTSVDTQWTWNMAESGGLPTGAQVEYWWTAEDAAGNSGRTETSTVSFDDNRYNWQSITSGPVTLLWYSGSNQFANALMSAAQEGLQRIQTTLGLTPQGNVSIYIYASASDLQGAQLFAQQWEGGVTFEGFDIIAIGVAPNQLSFGEGAIPHELTHWAVHQVTFNNYGAGLPPWLDEGLATYIQGLVPDYQAALNYAVSNNKLISVRSLSSPFSAITEQALISYGESQSIVTFLLRQYGEAKMDQLLNVFHQGATYDDALKQVYGFDQDGLDTLWRQSLGINIALDLHHDPVLPGAVPA
jgi:Peptidase MA superfamily